MKYAFNGQTNRFIVYINGSESFVNRIPQWEKALRKASKIGTWKAGNDIMILMATDYTPPQNLNILQTLGKLVVKHGIPRKVAIFVQDEVGKQTAEFSKLIGNLEGVKVEYFTELQEMIDWINT